MAEAELLNRMYHSILEWFIEHGRAPHYVELAHRLDLAAEEARRTLRELVDMGLPGVWQHPGTDYIESFENIYKDLAAKYKLPLIPFLLQGAVGVPGMMQPDGIHATVKGNEVVANLVMRTLQPLL